MIEAGEFVDAAYARGFSFYTGVPCSYLKPLINYVVGHSGVHADLMTGYGVTKLESLRELLGTCDAIVVHAALDDGSRGMLDHAALAHLRSGSVLVNAARGALVEPSAVLAALGDGRLGGYAADVFAPEDPNADPVNRAILGHDNVVVSAHRAFLSGPSERSQRVRVAEEVRRVLLDGDPPRFGRVA
jgi:D-3-phosphoglycerate dehydrogenase